jgi:hypothetical protein
MYWNFKTVFFMVVIFWVLCYAYFHYNKEITAYTVLRQDTKDEKIKYEALPPSTYTVNTINQVVCSNIGCKNCRVVDKHNWQCPKEQCRNSKEKNWICNHTHGMLNGRLISELYSQEEMNTLDNIEDQLAYRMILAKNNYVKFCGVGVIDWMLVKYFNKSLSDCAFSLEDANAF